MFEMASNFREMTSGEVDVLMTVEEVYEREGDYSPVVSS
jgi:hypothetical protein